MTSLKPGDLAHWWKRIDPLREYPYLVMVIAVGPKSVTISVEDPDDERKRLIRHVAPARLQPIAGYFAKAASQGPRIIEPPALWGRFTRFLEVGQDLRIVRHVDVFSNRNMLSYDRIHWIDDFGMLGDARIKRDRKRGPWGRSVEIEAAEFEQVWRDARASPLWRKQKETAQMRVSGPVPIWFTIDS